MLTVVNRVLLELRGDSAVHAIASDRIRSPEPAGAVTKPDGTKVKGDARGPGEYVAFVVLTELSTIPHPRVPTQQATVGMTCYGTTPIQAMDLFNACCDALHAIGPRVESNGLGIYVSHITSGGTVDKDPITSQPCVRAVIELTATTRVVTV